MRFAVEEMANRIFFEFFEFLSCFSFWAFELLELGVHKVMGY
jgi:hypothetical protein